MPGLWGAVINVRTPLDVMSGFFAADAEGFTPAGVQRRETFYASWDAIGEYWFEDPDAFAAIRRAGALDGFDDELFERSFYREVDETVAVMPNRAPAPAFYHR